MDRATVVTQRGTVEQAGTDALTVMSVPERLHRRGATVRWVDQCIRDGMMGPVGLGLGVRIVGLRVGMGVSLGRARITVRVETVVMIWFWRPCGWDHCGLAHFNSEGA